MIPTLEQMTIDHNSDLQAALAAIDRNAQGIVFVVDESNKPVGTLTDGDIRRTLLKTRSLDTLVHQAMNVDFVCKNAKTPDEEILPLLDEKIKHVPLVDEAGVLVDYSSLNRIRRAPIMEPCLGGNELAYVTDCIKSNWISSQGKYVAKFENQFSEFHGEGFAVSTSNGTCALHLALTALGIGPGDEVILPDLTFAATANAVIHAGATPVFVDVSPDTWGIDPDKIESALTSNTRALLPVHLYGHPCHMDRIVEIARRRDLFVIEDCAEAMGAEYKGEKVGLFGDAACFSFFGNKLITTGEGGMVLFKQKTLGEKAKLLRDHGMSKEKRYWHPEVGFNYRMTNLQAAIGLAQLEQVEDFLAAKIKLANAYENVLKDCPGLELPSAWDWAKNVCWLYTVRIDETRFGGRDEVIEKLLLNGIDARPVFYPLHCMPPYQKYARGKTFPISEAASRTGLSLPSAVTLELDEIARIGEVLKRLQSVRDIKNMIAK